MKKIFCIAVLFVLPIFVGCSDNTPKAVVTYDLLNTTEEMELKFSDLVDDIRIVTLEAKDSILISDCKYVINDKYIVAIDKKAIHQFDAITGKHIRVLAVEGNGPNEFKYVTGNFIKNGKFYYLSSGKNYISVINLSTGEYLPKLDFKDKKNFKLYGIFSDDEVYILNDSLLFERFNFNTQKGISVIDTLKYRKSTEKKDYSLSVISFGESNQLPQYKNEIFYYNTNFSDTLYVQGEKYAQPYAFFVIPQGKNNSSPGDLIPSGSEVRMNIPYVDSRFLLCDFKELAINSSSSSISVSLEYKGVYCIDRETCTAKRIKKYIFDPLFIKEFEKNNIKGKEKDAVSGGIYNSDNFAVDNEIYAKVLSAYKVKEYIKESLENISFSADKIAELQALDSRLSENGNPVVIIGKKK